MRKSHLFAIALVGALLVATTVVLYAKYQKSLESYAQIQAQDEATRARYGEAIGEISTIQDSLNAIVLGEEAVQALPARREAEAQLPGTLHDQVLTRISTLKGAIERTKDRITELDARLKKYGVRIAGLEKMVAGLRKSVKDKEERIALLTTQVDTLQTQVSGLTVTVQDQQQELATVFYAMGSKKELVRSGVVEADGGILGLGKTLKPTGHFDETAFTPLDTDQETVIRIPAKKAQVLSAQPVTSYVLEPAGTDMVQLRIVDPKEFRKIKQVVILTT